MPGLLHLGSHASSSSLSLCWPLALDWLGWKTRCLTLRKGTLTPCLAGELAEARGGKSGLSEHSQAPLEHATSSQMVREEQTLEASTQ